MTLEVGQHVRYKSDEYYSEYVYGLIEAIDGDDVTLKIWHDPRLDNELKDRKIIDLDMIDLIEALAPDDIKEFAEKLVAKHQAAMAILKEVLL